VPGSEKTRLSSSSSPTTDESHTSGTLPFYFLTHRVCKLFLKPQLPVNPERVEGTQGHCPSPCASEELYHACKRCLPVCAREGERESEGEVESESESARARLSGVCASEREGVKT